MNPSQSLARPLLASMFVVGGIDSIKNSESKVKVAEAVVKPLSRAVPAIPNDAEALVRFNGAVQVGAGLMLAAGRARRLAALALIGSIIPTTYAGHRFWEEADDLKRKQQLIHFCKNLGLLGGLILELDSGPKTKKRGRKRNGAKAASADKLTRASRKLARASRVSAEKISSGSADLAVKTKRFEKRAERSAQRAAAQASKFAALAAADMSKRSQVAAKRTHDVAGQYAHAASEQAGQALSYAHDHLGNLKVG